MGSSGSETAVVLLAFGAVESLEDVEPFLRNIMAGKASSPAMVEAIKERYRLIGGGSPLKEITLRQARALEDSLKDNPWGPFRVFVGMRHWHPYVKDTFLQIREASIKRIIAIMMAPHSSLYSSEGYRAALLDAVSVFERRPRVSFIHGWYGNRHFLEAVGANILEALDRFSNRDRTAVVFSAHALPARLLKPQDPYVEQLRRSIDGILEITGPLRWRLGFQSRGMGPGEWLGPDVGEILEGLPREGFEGVLMVPLGFVSDHVETLYDIDILYRKKAEGLGLRFGRSASLNDGPRLIEALKDLVLDPGADFIEEL